MKQVFENTLHTEIHQVSPDLTRVYEFYKNKAIDLFGLLEWWITEELGLGIYGRCEPCQIKPIITRELRGISEFLNAMIEEVRYPFVPECHLITLREIGSRLFSELLGKFIKYFDESVIKFDGSKN